MLKYSACEWPEDKGITTLEKAEAYTVQRYQDIAGLSQLPPGARVLELGCGWGSLSLANAKKYPHLVFVSFSNSPPQIEFIRRTAAERGLSNLTVSVEDYAIFVDPSKSSVAPAGGELFDTAMAIETIEHAQNIKVLLKAVSLRLRSGGKLFAHSLLHQSASYFMDSSSWMGRNFFSGGSILSLNSYFHLCPPEFHIRDVIPINGKGYSLTLLAWLNMQERNRSWMMAKYGGIFYEGFRMFYISTAEAFAANAGAEYMCCYYVFVKH
jgi:cyclopropane-fatty-acyl-phospholipid synthase